MRLIDIKSIVVGENRQRRTFDEGKISELSQSILENGLIHAPVVRQISESQYELIAGERRLRAIQQIQILSDSFRYSDIVVQPGFLPVTLVSELSELQLEAVELEENIRRVNLTVQEEAQAVARLHALREKQRGAPVTLTATAKEIYGENEANSGDVARVREQLLVAQNLDIPEVAKAKTLREAMKVIEKVKTREHRALLAESFDLTKTEHTLHFGSAFEVVKNLESASFDLIVTDPPYGIDAQNFGSQSSGHNYNDSHEYAKDCYRLVAVEGFRLTKPRASVYAFCDINRWAEFSFEFAKAGWIVWSRPLIWAKGNGMLPKPDFGPRNTYEAIIFAYKPDTKIVLQGQSDVLFHRVGTGLEHGAQKPVELYTELLSRSAEPASRVLDLFAGSGTIFPAATRARMTAVGIELIEDNYNLALTRMSEQREEKTSPSTFDDLNSLLGDPLL